MKTPNYIINKEYSIVNKYLDQKILPVGTFVKPINEYYLPNHIKESTEYRWFDKTTEVFVYCRYGIVAIPKNIIVEV